MTKPVTKSVWKLFLLSLLAGFIAACALDAIPAGAMPAVIASE